MIFLRQFLALALGLIATARAAEPAPGVNLEGIADWAAILPFADVMKSARAFGPPERPWENAVPADWNGWPTQDAGVVVFADQRSAPGVYDLRFEGRAEIGIPGDTAKIERPIHDPKTNTPTATIQVPANSNQLFLAFTGTDGGVRNVSLTRRPPASAGVFDKRFVDLVRRFSAVRFMDWESTNNSPLEKWSQRPLPTDARWSSERGVPLEVQIDLANRASVDAWFCVPHRADDDFVRRMAQMVHDHIGRKQRVYVEYSNECWNGIFGQARWCLDRGRALRLSDNEFQAQLRYYSQRTVEVTKIWTEVFADRPGQLVRIMATQFGNPWVSEQVLEWQDAAKHIDMLAIAPYFGLGDLAESPKLIEMTPQQILTDVDRNVLGAWLPKLLAEQSAMARRFKVGLTCYEAGQHLVGADQNNDRLTELLTGANRLPAMGALYTRYLELWSRQKAGPMFLFSLSGGYSRYGSWGLIESLEGVGTSPKWKAIAPKLRP
jgi:hypothetical protein